MTLDELTKAIAGARERSERVKNYLSRSPAEQDRDDLLAVIDQLLAEREAMQRDTARFRYLLAHANKGICGEWADFTFKTAMKQSYRYSVVELLDEAIDRAIEGER